MEWFGFGYAAVVGIGGVIGYTKAGSVISLTSGLLFGILSAFGSYQISKDPKDITVLMCSSGFLALLMGYRFFNSGKFMPAGLVFLLSVLLFGRLAFRMIT